jgi:hypothetical protein
VLVLVDVVRSKVRVSSASPARSRKPAAVGRAQELLGAAQAGVAVDREPHGGLEVPGLVAPSAGFSVAELGVFYGREFQVEVRGDQMSVGSAMGAVAGPGRWNAMDRDPLGPWLHFLVGLLVRIPVIQTTTVLLFATAGTRSPDRPAG